MTRIKQVLVIVLAFTIQALALPMLAEAKGPPVRIYSSDPPDGVQGNTYGVTLFGERFEDAEPEVRYIHKLTGIVAPHEKMGVSNPNFVDSTQIQYTLTIADNADIGDYDIEIHYATSGRKGKGTTLFSVKSKNSNTETVNCAPFTNPNYDPVNDPIPDPPLDPGRCNCMFQLNNESGDSGTPPGYIFNLKADCETGETLVIPQFGDLNSLGATTNDEADRKTITAVNGNPNNPADAAPFQGHSVIEAAGHRAHIRHMNITVGEDVVAGCEEDFDPDTETFIATAVSFVLDSGSPDPTDYDAFYRHTRWWVQTIHVDSPHDPLCVAFEFRRDPTYSQVPNTADAYEALVVVSGWVMENSYEKIGVLYEGFHWRSEGHTYPELLMFQVDPPKPDSRYWPVGIAVGGITSTDSSDLVVSLVQNNLVNLGGTGVGILVYGAVPKESKFRLDKNTISGVEFGILVDSNVEHINFSGNTLMGDGNTATDDIPICTDTPNWNEKGKPNRISGWSRDGVTNNSTKTSGCPTP